MNRSVALGAAWSASAVAAVGLGFLAVSLVDASATPGTSPVAATTSASTTSAPTSSASTTPEAPSGTSTIPSPSLTLATGEYATVAGTVFADCSTGFPLLGGAPAAGWWIDDSDEPWELEFESAGQKLEVHVSCVNGSPQFFDEGLRADDDGRRGGDDGRHSSASASSPSAQHTSGHDDSRGDSSGRGRGGHGSDDSGRDDSSGHGGDDSSGRGSGGHGSDDD